ncbi:hypothetical protein Runsl_4216 [Runella slithyformis DSM 19594]|uniref:Uncharacterized protein n=1 Tax=Runella slithyformis (strain ATCC 29530 / DSM 19594 / LMG 11500 / NCIMB 11436 / LSU 4) TaxID=761193 RepID=A0A7U3ZNN7_RUNSL|nr:hypothetical protein Runsl_4216 [Runella slithyformis DSM 19594]
MKRILSIVLAIVCIVAVFTFIYTDNTEIKKVCQGVIAITSVANLILNIRQYRQM